MGFLRKTLWVGTLGTSEGIAGIKPNSKKERAANALEKQTKIMKQQAAFEQAELLRQTAAAAQRAQVVQTPTPFQPIHEAPAKPFIADELLKLAALRNEGVITEAEFNSQKARWLQH